jgi:hypothetical protein
LSIVLAPDEKPVREAEKTYSDLLADYYHHANKNDLLCYKLSAPNISYPEALLYVYFLVTNQQLRPAAVILQLNYESFRKTGVRDGMLELLSDPAFKKVIEHVATSNEAFAGTFQQALARFEQLRVRSGDKPGETGEASPARKVQNTGISLSYGFGNRMETDFRAELERFSWFRQRHEVKGSFLDLLYLSRVYLLRVKPSTPRPLGGAPLDISRSALARIADLCKQSGTKLILFNAPQNPSSPLYRTEKDRKTYVDATSIFAAGHHLPFYDFENSIPQPYWGVWVDGPDPIHFGRKGHHAMSELFIRSGILSGTIGANGASIRRVPTLN